MKIYDTLFNVNMICKECGKELKNYVALGLHLKNFHNMTSKEYYDKYIRTLDEGICPTCGKETTFQGIRLGYLTYCSVKCAQSNTSTREKYKKTCLDKYGSTNVFSSEYGKRKIKESTLKSLGVEYPQQSENVRIKSRQTKKEKYGDENYNNPEKNKQTCLEHFGVDSYSKTEDFKKVINDKIDFSMIVQKGLQTKQQNITNYIENGYVPIQQVIKDFGESWYKNKIVPIQFVSGTGLISADDYAIVSEYFHKESGHSSQEEQKLYNLIRTYYDGEIIRGTYKVLKNQELDLYLPELKLAFEYNGSYFHSTKLKSIDYHYEKSIRCFNLGIRLIHIFDFEDWDTVTKFIADLFNDNEQVTNDFNKYSPLQFEYNQITFSGPQLLYTLSRGYEVYGSGSFTLN